MRVKRKLILTTSLSKELIMVKGRYDQLLEKYGKEEADAEMARRRSLVKNVGGFRSDPNLARKAQLKSAKARVKNNLADV